MNISASMTSYLAAASHGTYTVVDRKGKRITIQPDSTIIDRVHKARQNPKHYKFIHRILSKLVIKIHKFLDSDFFYK